jgi:hypothetical protein
MDLSESHGGRKAREWGGCLGVGVGELNNFGGHPRKRRIAFKGNIAIIFKATNRFREFILMAGDIAVHEHRALRCFKALFLGTAQCHYPCIGGVTIVEEDKFQGLVGLRG